MIATRTASSASPAGHAGAVGPVALSALILLLVAAPLMRGGNRHVAMIVLEAAALAFLAAIVYRAPLRLQRPTFRDALLWFVCLSPAWLALVYLWPTSAEFWSTLPARGEYAQFLAAAHLDLPDRLAASLVPDATLSSLLTGVPILAAFLAGLWCTPRQFRLVCMVLVASALVQILIGMLQMAGGQNSALFAGSPSGRPLGTFANPNHLGNYIAMGLCAFAWLAWDSSSNAHRPKNLTEAQAAARRKFAWILTALVLVVGVLMTTSRGATLSGLASALAMVLLVRTARAKNMNWKRTLLAILAAVAIGAVLVGVDSIMSRFGVSTLVADAPSRTIQASTTLEGARHFWPLGSGWGTYGTVYPRYQPASLVGIADYAHQDYAQMLFEGGIFAVLLMAAMGWLLVTRAVALVRAGMRRRRLRTEEMAAAICGLGLLGFLLHSFVEFNMHIPANAILAALLAGAYLRPLGTNEDS